MKKLSSLLIGTFSPWKNNTRMATNGMIEPMLYYFCPRVKEIFLLDQPYPGSDRILPRLETYQKGKLKGITVVPYLSAPIYPLLKIENKPDTRVSFKLRDFLSVLEVGLQQKKTVDLFIGLESINTLAGILLKRLGKVKTVAYYVSDYSPNRFSSKLFNHVYLWLDRIAARNTDYIWDVSPAMQPARISVGLDPKKSAPVIHVPNGLFKEQIDALPFTKREPLTLVFVGTLGLENGPDLAIEAFKIIYKKFPKAHLHIIGGGGKGFEVEYLKSLIKKYRLEKNITFHGFIKETKDVSSLIKHFSVAIAPYKMIPGSIRLYGDATKIRLYLAAGLPIVTTPVPPLGKEVTKKGAAITVDDNPQALAKAVMTLFSHTAQREKLTKNAIKLAKENTWENTYKNALSQMR